MDLSTKIGIGIIVAGIVVLFTVTLGIQMNNNRLIKEGYYQEKTVYCSQYPTQSIWKK